MIEPLNTWFGEAVWPPTDYYRRIKQASCPVGSYGLVVALNDWESKAVNSVSLEERQSISRAALDAYLYLYELGHSYEDDDLIQLKLRCPMRLYSAKLDKEITLF